MKCDTKPVGNNPPSLATFAKAMMVKEATARQGKRFTLLNAASQPALRI